MSALSEMLWSIRTGTANEDARVAAACAVGKSGDRRFAKHLLPLLEDQSAEVRYYALQALVFGLQQTDKGTAERCWGFLLTDPGDQVRSMAVACLGKISFGSRSPVIFRRLKEELRKRDQPMIVKASIYDALFQVVGRPPREWPGVVALSGSEKDFGESDIDWRRLAELEREFNDEEVSPTS